jgi:hypothetical protein
VRTTCSTARPLGFYLEADSARANMMRRLKRICRSSGRFHLGHGSPFLAVFIRESPKALSSITMGHARDSGPALRKFGIDNLQELPRRCIQADLPVLFPCIFAASGNFKPSAPKGLAVGLVQEFFQRNNCAVFNVVVRLSDSICLGNLNACSAIRLGHPELLK